MKLAGMGSGLKDSPARVRPGARGDSFADVDYDGEDYRETGRDPSRPTT